MQLGDYTVNPFLGMALTTSRPVAGQGIQEKQIILDQAGAFMPLLRELVASGFFRSLETLLLAEDLGTCEIPEAHLRWLVQTGFLIPRQEEVSYPLYAVEVLDPHLPLPATLALVQPERLCLNPALCPQWELALPPVLQGQVRGWERLAPQRPLLWVRAPLSHLWFPYVLPPVQLERLLSLTPQQLPAYLQGLSDFERERLVAAQILVGPEALLLQHSPVPPLAEVLAAKLVADDYLILQQLLPPLQVARLRQYIQVLTARGFFRLGDNQVKRRGAIHNEHLLRFFHFQIEQLLNHLLPEPIKASYAYLTTYLPGAVLTPHTDRDQCVWNLSLLLDTVPEVGREDAWPFYLKTGERTTRVLLGLGDAVLYSGTRVPHWRERLPEGHYVSLGLLHFVTQDFQADLN